MEFKPIFSREDELRYAGELIGKEESLRNAIAEKIPQAFVRKLAKANGISQERLNELYAEARDSAPPIGKGADQRVGENMPKGEQQEL
ncbi:MAG: hypothetical protein FWG30_02890 [Eubacteriaceae bacterium]|nr:hypothetical protein [Eubacteriaceae bacterium]